MPARQYAPDSADPSGPAGRPVPAAPAGLPAALPERGRIKAGGVIDRITIAPVTSSPSFTALVRIDWNGAKENVRIVWMGQRRVPGIEAGVSLRFEGMLSRVDGTPTVYNPRYEIIGRPEEY
ncbi:single stranded DNA-binding domain-containing protein [Arthrobacter sp. MDT2-2]